MLLTNPWIILVLVVGFLGFGAAGYFKGRHDEHAAVIAAELEQQKQATVTVVKQGEVTEQVALKAEEKAVEIRTVTQTIIKEVPVYVTQKAAARCVVPRGFVRLLNDSASGVPTVPDPAGVADDSPAGVSLDSVGGTTAANLGSCREIISNYTNLQDWVTQQARR